MKEIPSPREAFSKAGRALCKYLRDNMVRLLDSEAHEKNVRDSIKFVKNVTLPGLSALALVATTVYFLSTEGQVTIKEARKATRSPFVKILITHHIPKLKR